MLFQFGALFTDMSVYENVAFPMREHTDLDKAWKEFVAIEEEFDATEAGAPGFLTRTYDKAKKK